MIADLRQFHCSVFTGAFLISRAPSARVFVRLLTERKKGVSQRMNHSNNQREARMKCAVQKKKQCCFPNSTDSLF